MRPATHAKVLLTAVDGQPSDGQLRDGQSKNGQPRGGQPSDGQSTLQLEARALWNTFPGYLAVYGHKEDQGHKEDRGEEDDEGEDDAGDTVQRGTQLGPRMQEMEVWWGVSMHQSFSPCCTPLQPHH